MIVPQPVFILTCKSRNYWQIQGHTCLNVLKFKNFKGVLHSLSYIIWLFQFLVCRYDIQTLIKDKN